MTRNKRRGKKPHELRYRLLMPLLAIVLILNLSIFIFFNVAQIYSLDSTIKSNLKSIAATMQNFYWATDHDTLAERQERLISIYDTAITSRPSIGGVNLLFVNEYDNVYHSYPTLSDVEAARLTVKIRKHEIPIQGLDKITMLNTFFDAYSLQPVNTYLSKDTKIYILSSTNSMSALLKSSNRWLLMILIGTTILFLIVISFLATKLSNPLQKLAIHADNIGNGILQPVPVDNSCVELQKLGNSINQMVEKIDAYDVAQKASLQNMSHELRTPLMSIQGYAEGIKCGVFDDTDQAADIIIEESIRLSNLVNQMLTLSRLDSLNQQLHLSTISLQQFFEEHQKKIEGFSFKERIALSSEITPANLTVYADAQLLSTVLSNLMSNCIRYAKTQVSVTAVAEGSRTIITVRDDGEGLSAKDLHCLFDRFYTGKAGNFGLGLSTAKSATEYMKGTLSAANNPEGGASFTLNLPTHEC